jgi:hypothetical protein
MITTTTAFPAPAQVLGISMDALGRPWVVNRVSFSGPQPSTLSRLDPATGNIEVVAPIGIGGNNFPDGGGFHYAYVVDQFTDSDGDGSVNFGEVLGGTSPFDAQSNPRANLEVTGVTKIGSTAQIVAGGTPAGITVVFFSRGRGPGLTVPGITGQVFLDPLGLFGFTVSIGVPGSLALPIPNDPSLDAAVLQVQGLYIGATTQFTNLTCARIWM